MAPPKFKDVDKSTTDLFNDDFPFSAVALKLESTARNGVTFTVDGAKRGTDVSGSLETKYTHSSGVSVREKWTTSNAVETELSVQDKFIPKSKFSLTAGFLPNKGLSSVAFKGDIKRDAFTFDFGAALVGKPKIDVGVLGAYKDYVFGASVSYSIASGSLSSHKFAAGYNDQDVSISSSITNGSLVEGSVFHAPVDGVSTGVTFAWDKASPTNTAFAIAGKYQLDKDAFVKAKVDKDLNVGLGYTQNLRPGVKISLGMQINGQQLQSNNIGLKFSMKN